MNESPSTDQKISNIEKRLALIEACLGIKTSAVDLSSKSAAGGQGSSMPQSQPFMKPFQSHNAKINSEGNFLGIVALICFVLAAGFIIKLAIESGWLTPFRQVGTAAIFGFSLIGLGFYFFKKDRSYASLLPAAGIVILYLSIFGAYRWYHLVSFPIAISFVTLVSGLCIGIYAQLREDMYPLVAVVGSYMAPVFLGFGDISQFTIYYFLFCSMAFSIISILMQSRVTSMVGVYLAIAVTVAGAVFSNQTGEVTALLLPAHFLIYTLGTFFYTYLNKKSLTAEQSWGFLPVLLFFYACEYYSLNSFVPFYAPWISLGFAAFLLGLYFVAKRTQSIHSGPMILAFTSVIFFHSFYLEILPDDARAWLFVVIVGSFAFLNGTDFKLPRFQRLTLLLVAVIEYMRIIGELLENDRWYLPVAMVSTMTLLGAFYYLRDRLKRQPPMDYVVLIMAHALAVLSLYSLGQPLGSLIVSVLWLCYAVAIMTLGYLRRDQIMAKSALFVLTFSAGKVLLYDLSNADSLVRIFCLILTGAVLYGCGYFLRRISQWKELT